MGSKIKSQINRKICSAKSPIGDPLFLPAKRLLAQSIAAFLLPCGRSWQSAWHLKSVAVDLASKELQFLG
jgi:hypothetical protein